MKRIRLVLVTLFLLTVQSYGETRTGEVPYCSLFSSTKYNEQIVVTKAILFVPDDKQTRVDGGERFFFSPECNNRDYFGLAESSPIKPHDLLKRRITSADQQKSHRLYEVKFKARLSISLPPSFGHLNFLRAKFHVISIKAAKEISDDKELPNLTQRASIIDNARLLNLLNTELMFSVASAQLDELSQQEYFSKGTIIVFNGAQIPNANILNVIRQNQAGEFRYQLTKMSKKDKIWKIQGFIKSVLQGNASESLHYNNTFMIDDDGNWKLLEFVGDERRGSGDRKWE